MNLINFIILLFCLIFTFEKNGNSVVALRNRNNNNNGHVNCDLPDFPNGSIRLRPRSKMAKFQCFKSFKLIGNRYAACNDGEWDQPTPVCAKSGCPLMKSPKNGFTVIENDDTTIILFCLEGYKLTGSQKSYCNGKEWDRPLGSCVETTTVSQRSCDFENDEHLCGWTHDETDDFEWIRKTGWNNNTKGLLKGPQYDHTTLSSNGHYMLSESFNNTLDDKARLISPVYFANMSIDTCFKFYYYMYGASVGELKVYFKPISVDINAVTKDRKYLYFEKNGNQGSNWQEGLIFFEKFKEDFQIIIESSAGKTHLSDIAIDDVSILDESECIDDGTTLTSNTEINMAIYDVQSCVGRCFENISIAQEADSYDLTLKNSTGHDNIIQNCNCHSECEDTMSCCPDFTAVCAFPTTQETDITYTVSTSMNTKVSKIITNTTPTTMATSKIAPGIETPPTITTTTVKSITVKRNATFPPMRTLKPKTIRNFSSPIFVIQNATVPLATSTIKSRLTSSNSDIKFQNKFSSVKLISTMKPPITSTPYKVIKSTKDDKLALNPKTSPKSQWIYLGSSTMIIHNPEVLKSENDTNVEIINEENDEEQNEVQHDDPKFSVTEVKENGWKLNPKVKNDNSSIWTVILIAVIVCATVCIVSFLIVKCYRSQFGAANYRSCLRRFMSTNQEDHDVLYSPACETLEISSPRFNGKQLNSSSS